MCCALGFIGIILEIFKNQVFFLIRKCLLEKFSKFFFLKSVEYFRYIYLQTSITLVNIGGSSIKTSTKERYKRKIYYSDSSNPRLPA